MYYAHIPVIHLFKYKNKLKIKYCNYVFCIFSSQQLDYEMPWPTRVLMWP